jgi:hypothetical protein
MTHLPKLSAVILGSAGLVTSKTPLGAKVFSRRALSRHREIICKPTCRGLNLSLTRARTEGIETISGSATAVPKAINTNSACYHAAAMKTTLCS